MIALLQRVSGAGVRVGQQVVGEINNGLLVFIGVEQLDSEAQADRLCERILSYRVFADAQDKMNLSVADTGGGVLLVPQFTLAADTNTGNRPSFSGAAAPAEAERLFDYLLRRMRTQYNNVQSGQFGADMQVSLVNDGPVTFWLQVKPD